MRNTLTTDMLCISHTMHIQHDDQGLYSKWSAKSKSDLLTSSGECECPIQNPAHEKTGPRGMLSYIPQNIASLEES